MRVSRIPAVLEGAFDSARGPNHHFRRLRVIVVVLRNYFAAAGVDGCCSTWAALSFSKVTAHFVPPAS